MGPMARALQVTKLSVAPDEIGRFEEEWRSLEERPDRAPFLCWDWLAQWTRVYRPQRLSLLRVAASDRSVVALGLVEDGPLGIWRFAGRPITPQRGLLCGRPDEEGEIWRAFGLWLQERRAQWSLLQAEGVGVVPAALPWAHLAPETVPRLELPASFDDYLSARSSENRKALKKKLRRAERVGAVVGEADDRDRGRVLDELVRLHGERARSKGERHVGVDPRLARALDAIAHSSRLNVRVLELTLAGQTIGASIRVDRDRTAYAYNVGIDPAHAALSPGILLELESIRDAIERGLAVYDMGPGDYKYKLDLGGVPTTRFGLEATSRSLRGRLLAVAIAARRFRR